MASTVNVRSNPLQLTKVATDATALERDLIAAARKGSHEAFAGLVRMHQQRAYRVCRAIVASHEDAEDSVQEGFTRVFLSLNRYDPARPFGGWLFRIMSNVSLDLIRRRKIHDTDELPETVAMAFADPGETDDLRRRLSKALLALGQRQRSVVVLHDVEGFTHGEIAEMLAIPEGTARSDLHHARRILRGLLAGFRQARGRRKRLAGPAVETFVTATSR